MGVQQDDFVGLAAVDLAGVAQPDHVLGVVAAVFVAGAGLRHHEGLKPVLAQFGQHRGSGDARRHRLHGGLPSERFSPPT